MREHLQRHWPAGLTKRRTDARLLILTLLARQFIQKEIFNKKKKFCRKKKFPSGIYWNFTLKLVRTRNGTRATGADASGK